MLRLKSRVFAYVLCVALAPAAPAQNGAQGGEWRTYGGDLGRG